MLNCPCIGENANCFYCDGTGIKREQITNTFYAINKYEQKVYKVSSKMEILDIRTKIKLYSDSNLNNYKQKILFEYLNTFNREKKARLLEIIDIVTFELVWRKRYSSFPKKSVKSYQTVTVKKSKKTSSKQQNLKNKPTKKPHFQTKSTDNTNIAQKETILGVKLSNYFKKISERDVDRKLDGSRDFYQYREFGKFGSHSSYDDFGDESFS
jgi:hypothetical protein